MKEYDELNQTLLQMEKEIQKVQYNFSMARFNELENEVECK